MSILFACVVNVARELTKYVVNYSIDVSAVFINYLINSPTNELTMSQSYYFNDQIIN